MKRIVITFVCSSLIVVCSAFADDSQVNANSNQGVSTAQVSAPQKSVGLKDEKFGIKPQFGVLNYVDATSSVSNRAVYGATFEFNLGDFVNNISNLPRESGLYLGPEFGFFFSHIGAVGSNFLGDNTNTGPPFASSDPGANMFYVPTDIKAGWTFGPVRLSAHGGANLIYRSDANAVQVGVNSPLGFTASKWGYLPNAGADLEYGVLNGIAIILRPDWTFAGSNRLFSGTAGLSFPLG